MSEFVRLGDHITIAKGKPPAELPFDGPGASLYLTPEYLRGRSVAHPAKPGADAVAVADGDAVLLWDGSNAGEFFSGRAGLAASTMARIRADESIHRGYLVHALKHFERRLKSQTNGTGIPHVDRKVLEDFQVFRPVSSEQARIATILDTLDTTIRQTEAIIEKLKQIKQGLLHDLLTRGIDANGALRPPQSQAPHLYKDSPLGWIPREWEIKQGCQVCSEIVVGIVVRPTQYYCASGVPILRSANVREQGLTLDDVVFMNSRDHKSQQKSAVRPGDVLTVRTGYPGTSCVVDDQVTEANCVDIIISRPSAGTSPHYWAMWINSSFGKEQVLRVQGGLAQQHFNVSELAAMWVAMPRSSEQAEIVERVGSMNVRMLAEERSVALIRDVKFGLMDDLLTGRVRINPLLA